MSKKGLVMKMKEYEKLSKKTEVFEKVFFEMSDLIKADVMEKEQLVVLSNRIINLPISELSIDGKFDKSVEKLIKDVDELKKLMRNIKNRKEISKEKEEDELVLLKLKLGVITKDIRELKDQNLYNKLKEEKIKILEEVNKLDDKDEEWIYKKLEEFGVKGEVKSISDLLLDIKSKMIYIDSNKDYQEQVPEYRYNVLEKELEEVLSIADSVKKIESMEDNKAVKKVDEINESFLKMGIDISESLAAYKKIWTKYRNSTEAGALLSTADSCIRDILEDRAKMLSLEMAKVLLHGGNFDTDRLRIKIVDTLEKAIEYKNEEVEQKGYTGKIEGEQLSFLKNLKKSISEEEIPKEELLHILAAINLTNYGCYDFNLKERILPYEYSVIGVNTGDDNVNTGDNNVKKDDNNVKKMVDWAHKSIHNFGEDDYPRSYDIKFYDTKAKRKAGANKILGIEESKNISDKLVNAGKKLVNYNMLSKLVNYMEKIDDIRVISSEYSRERKNKREDFRKEIMKMVTLEEKVAKKEESKTNLGRENSQGTLGRENSQGTLVREDSNGTLVRKDSQTTLVREDSQTKLKEIAARTKSFSNGEFAPSRSESNGEKVRTGEREGKGIGT